MKIFCLSQIEVQKHHYSRGNSNEIGTHNAIDQQRMKYIFQPLMIKTMQTWL